MYGLGVSGIVKQADHIRVRLTDPPVFLLLHGPANTYPGCACDIPAHLYSYSMETDMDWSRGYPQQHGKHFGGVLTDGI